MELVWDEIYENERWQLRKGWASCPQIRLDPAKWTNISYQKVQSTYDHRLPSSDNEHLRWIWVDDWHETDWRYAISFGATIGKFAFKEKRSKKHFARRRIWRRPRIRKIEIGTTEIEEQVIENQRIMLKTWRSPYFPGDRPHYTDKTHTHPLTMKQVESRLPPSWLWVQTQWISQIGEHTDKNGWEYAVDFHAGGWTNSFKQFVHNVRRKKWIRNRKLSGLIKETKKLDVSSYNKKEYKRTISATPDINEIIIDEDDDIDMDDGWGDDDQSRSEPSKPPFEIAICWKYNKVFRETKGDKTLAIWKPNVEIKNDEKEQDEECYILGYLALSHRTDPNDNIPTLTVKPGSDKYALRPPQDFEVIYKEESRKNYKNKDIDIYRYWLKLIPPQGYIAMGSIVIEKYKKPIQEADLLHLKGYIYGNNKYLRVYSLDKLMCIHEKYVNVFGQALVERLLTSKKSQFTLHRPQPIVVSGVYKLVEMACIIRQKAAFTKVQSSDNNVKMEHFCACITPRIMNLCVDLLQYNIRIVGDSPLIISYATHFNLAWSSKCITTTSNTKAAVWEPVLGPDEFMVGMVAFGDWLHPALHENNYKLVIIKSGGSDPDAFKEPLGFECIWSVYKPGQKKRLKNRSLGSGLLLSKVGGSVGLVDDESPPSASFWRAIPPQGYTALGDVALPIDGVIATTQTKDGSKSKVRIDTLLKSHDVPKYVCIKNEYLANFRRLEVDDNDDYKANKMYGEPLKKQSTIIENKVRSRIWISSRCKDLTFHAAIYEQEPVTRDILSPMFCKSGCSAPTSSELFPTLSIECIIEAQPYWNVAKSGILKKKGEGFIAQSHKRFFVLTNDKCIYYYQEIELKGKIDLNEMRECDMAQGSDTEFYISTPQRKWGLEVVDESEGAAMDWVKAIRSIKNSNINDGLHEMSQTEESEYKSEAMQMGEKESQEQKIVVLLSKMLKQFEDLVKHTRSENETTESVANAVKWYEDLENTRCAIDILLNKWPRGTICPPGVVRARAQLKDLMEESQQVILDDICALANENMSRFTVLRLHKACILMSDLDKGQMMISQWITEILLKNAGTVFAAGNRDSDLIHIERRFNEYRRQMKEYDKRYKPFIPGWWMLPIQIGSRFCNLMGETLDNQLTQYPENSDAIAEAKKKCIAFEKELIEDAMRRMCCIEIDVRSWTKWDKGDSVSYIKIDDDDIMVKGTGICVVVLDLLTKKVLKKRLFPISKHSAFKGKHKDKHKKVLTEWLNYLDDIDGQSLVIMVSHEHSGHCQFKKQLGVDVPKQLLDLHINANHFAEELNLWTNKEPFIFIGRKCKKDPYYTLMVSNKGRKRALMTRHIISPYIPKHKLNKLVDIESIPFYEGIISQVLERHLDIFVGSEARNVHHILQSVLEEESMNKLEQNKNWLSAINRMQVGQKSNAHFDSVLKIKNCMKQGIANCIKISCGKPLLGLLRKYAEMLRKYASILLQLMNDCGGDKLKNKLFTTDNKTISDLLDDNNKDKKRGLNINISFSNKSDTVQIQFFVIYCCMIYNSCSQIRELVNELIKIGTHDLQPKYQGSIKSNLIEIRELFLSIEEQCLQLIRAAVMNKFECIFQFERHMHWKLDEYKKELTVSFDNYLANCSKLLTPSALEHFYKVFVAHFALRVFNQILHSPTLNSSSDDVTVLIDFPPMFESVILSKVPSRIIRKMQIYINRCLNPLTKLIQMAYANAGDKYHKLESIKKDNKMDKLDNIFSKFFGGGDKDNNKNNEKQQIVNDDPSQEISNTVFAQKAVQFYTDNTIRLHILGNVPSYKEIFAEDEDEFILTTDAAAESIAKALDTSLKDVENELKENELNSDSDSPLPDLNTAASTRKSSSGFAVKKSKKKHKKKPKAAPPPVPPKHAPPKPVPQKSSVGLNTMSLVLKKEVKMNRKWNVIEKIMALRGFDVADQQTIRVLCEQAQSNIESSQ